MAVELRSLLLVDDDQEWLASAQRLLRSAPIRLRTATNASDAHSIGVAERPQVAIVDLFFGDQPEGFAIARDLKAHVPGVKVALCTAMVMDVPGAWSGVDLVVSKPFSLGALIRRLDGVQASSLEAEELPRLADVEREHVRRVLASCAGNLSRAARVLGITRSGLQKKLERLGLR